MVSISYRSVEHLAIIFFSSSSSFAGYRGGTTRPLFTHSEISQILHRELPRVAVLSVGSKDIDTPCSRGEWWVVIYTACKSLAKWWGLFLGTSHFDLEGGQKYPPVGICGERIPPPELQISLNKISSLSIIDGFEIYIQHWIGNDVYNVSKIAAILNFHGNMPPSWIV